jgi:hypothetical protein
VNEARRTKPGERSQANEASRRSLLRATKLPFTSPFARGLQRFASGLARIGGISLS